MATAATIADQFIVTFGREPEYCSRAPGRVNLIGEHTDYNDGLVLPMAIDRSVDLWFAPRSDATVHLSSLNFSQSHRFSLDQPIAKSEFGWANFVLGVVAELKSMNVPLTGMDALIDGNIPVASGLSSSAAIEIATVLAFLQTTNSTWATPLEIAQIGQRAEQNFIGVQCGLMDQFISAAAIAGTALKIDCYSMSYEAVEIPEQISMVVANTKLSRSLAASAYNERREECTLAFDRLKRVLVQQDQFHHPPDAIHKLNASMLERGEALLPVKLSRRLRHVVSENGRVEQAAAILCRQPFDPAALGQLLNESHNSLRDDFEVSSEGLNRVVLIMQSSPGCFGARLTGAGFGGCAIALVDSNQLVSFLAEVRERSVDFDPQPDFFPVIPSSGGEVKQLNSDD
ncbi:MAG: galactokinase [Planctomycetota bacterium]